VNYARETRSNMIICPQIFRIGIGLAALWLAQPLLAQLVGLPLPRLLTLMPMGGPAGSSVEVTVTGDDVDDASELLFSNPKITAKPKQAADGKAESSKFVVTVAADAPPGVYEARLMTRLGISSSRAFAVGTLPEVIRDKPNTTAATALEFTAGVVCNAFTTGRAIDHYTFHASKDRRLLVDCAAADIDSKLTPVLIVADRAGHDLVASRHGGVLEFTPPADGDYLLRVHDLTYQGGPAYFYRLALLDAAGGASPSPQANMAINRCSLPADDTSGTPAVAEIEPNDKPAEVQKITLPCQIAGTFAPAADVDTFEFEAKKDEQWWVEVVSERLGLPTDPFVVVQHVVKEGDAERLEDVAELNDIASPIKVSSNFYSYDGPPYNSGSADVLGKVDIKADGTYRLQLRDLFGGTRNDPRNVYKLIVRKAAPDFALVAWALHMELRNGDRSALSKPIAMRPGGTMALEVIAIRRDGFDGEIELAMEDLPEGMSACGLKIPAGKSRGILLVTAADNAPRSLAAAKLLGRAQIAGAAVSRPCRLASMTWPVKEAMSEIPRPRLLADVQVSVGDAESAPISIRPTENKVWQAKTGEKLTIPLSVTWRGEFSGALRLKTFGAGFEGAKEIDIANKAATAEAVFDLAALKTPAGEYTVAFYGPVTTKHRAHLVALAAAEEAHKKAEQELLVATATAKRLADEAQAAGADKKAEAEAAAKTAAEAQKRAEAEKVATANRLKTATDAAAPADTVDIAVSEPIRISVLPADGKLAGK
jgi:hypothetical protein